eukprot:9494943-Pyramimonas_sp.AAC.1
MWSSLCSTPTTPMRSRRRRCTAAASAMRRDPPTPSARAHVGGIGSSRQEGTSRTAATSGAPRGATGCREFPKTVTA